MNKTCVLVSRAMLRECVWVPIDDEYLSNMFLLSFPDIAGMNSASVYERYILLRIVRTWYITKIE